MNKKLFAELVESMTQMNEIAHGARAPSREFHVDALSVKARRSKVGLSQPIAARQGPSESRRK